MTPTRTKDQDIETLKSWILSGAKPDKQEESNSNELNCYYRHFDKFKILVAIFTESSKQIQEKAFFSTWYRKKRGSKYSKYCMIQFGQDI